MSQYSFSYNYDSLNDAFNAVNRKGKMQKRYLSPEYLAAAQEYREMRKELNEMLRKKKAERTEEDLSQIDYWKQQMKENAQKQENLLQEHLTKVSSSIYPVAFVSTLRQMRQKIQISQFILLEPL
jgi:recombinational DNA repair ATPase RecF